MKKTYLALVSIIILVMTSLGSIAWGQSSISLVGDGTEFGWPPFPGDDPNDPIQLERIGDTDTWVAFGIELYGGPVKFRENNTWDDDDWGGVWPSGNTTAANINTEEGIYNVFLNLANNTFGFQEAGEVTFRLDLSQNRLADLNPRVFLAGNVQTPDWQEPGTNTAYQLEESGTEPGIYEITFFAELGSREFKFFALPSDIANQTEAGWEYGEWAGGPNRSVDIQAGQTYEFTWGPARVLNTTADFNLSTNNNPSFQIQESIPGTLPETLSSAIEGIALLNDDSEILINLEPSDWTRDGNTLSINSAIIQDQEPSEGQSIPFLIRFDRSTLENDVVLVQVDIIDFDSFALSSPANEAAFDTNESGNIVFEWDELSEDDPSYTVYVGLASADLSDPDQRLLTLAADDGGELNRLTIDRQSLFDDLVAAANIDLSNISSLSFSWNVEANFSADGEPQTALSTNGPRTFTLIPPRYEVAFQVDMSQSTAYDPNSENIFLSGTITDPAFQLPGSNQDLQLSAEGDGVYTLTLELFPGEYQYKYFRVPIGGETFDNGEWVGDPNRSVTIT
ncbi:MAG: hypothetical protein LAT68_15490, partial [Cyclobacteriaceae bacterium]|nr:hypothetical protein [Cyclobacteriaceae bacterium]